MNNNQNTHQSDQPNQDDQDDYYRGNLVDKLERERFTDETRLDYDYSKPKDSNTNTTY